jgi:hypothetical protein
VSAQPFGGSRNVLLHLLLNESVAPSKNNHASIYQLQQLVEQEAFDHFNVQRSTFNVQPLDPRPPARLQGSSLMTR